MLPFPKKIPFQLKAAGGIYYHFGLWKNDMELTLDKPLALVYYISNTPAHQYTRS
jgi:hypothetical protein